MWSSLFPAFHFGLFSEAKTNRAVMCVRERERARVRATATKWHVEGSLEFINVPQDVILLMLHFNTVL